MIFAPILRGPDTEGPSASTDSTIKQTQKEEPAAQLHEEPTQIPLVDDLYVQVATSTACQTMCLTSLFLFEQIDPAQGDRCAQRSHSR